MPLRASLLSAHRMHGRLTGQSKILPGTWLISYYAYSNLILTTLKQVNDALVAFHKGL